MNLLQEEQIKKENTIAISLIPGPSEPSIDINSYLKPLVYELISFWEGVELTVRTFNGDLSSRVVKAALLCVACDLPAGRKVCGFLSHSATLGCSRCLKEFNGSIGQKDYSGFIRETWPKHTYTKHMEAVRKVSRSKNKTEKTLRERETGCRYSELFRLPYFDPITMCIIDPMHNVFLGSVKHLYKNIWPKQNIIDDKDLPLIQSHVNTIVVPPNIGRIPRKIVSAFPSLTADEWKNWACLYSIIALHDVLPKEHFECWRLLALACRYLCKWSLTSNDIEIIDMLLIKFCKCVEQLYGRLSVTSNMHLHGHLKDCLLDYGPPTSFWLFAFEKLNGILGSTPTNNRSIEMQFFSRFLEMTYIHTVDLPETFYAELSPLFQAIIVPNLVASNTRVPYVFLNAVESSEDWSLSSCSGLTLPKTSIREVFNEAMQSVVFNMYSVMYHINISVPATFLKYSSIKMCDITYGSTLGSIHSKIVMVKWLDAFFGPWKQYADSPDFLHSLYHPALIQCFCKQSVCAIKRRI